MAVAAHAGARAPRTPRWLASLRWALRGAGAFGCAAAMLATPELISELLRDGAPLAAISVESLLAYRALALAAGVSLLAVAEFLPRLALRHEAWLAPIGILPPLFVLVACVAIKAVLGPEHVAYTSLTREDGAVEYATSVAYLAAGFVAASVVRGLRRRRELPLAVLWGAFAIALVLVSLEEISWGQRLFGVQTPELLSKNVQGEMNLHNLPWSQRGLHGAYIAVGLLGGLAWAPTSRWGSARFRDFVRWIVPPAALLGYFLPVAVFYAVLTFTPTRWIAPDGLRFGFVSTYDQEPVEFLLSLGFLLFTVHGLVRLRGGPGVAEASQRRERGAQHAEHERPLVRR